MERQEKLKCWFLRGGVCILGYEMFRRLTAVKKADTKDIEKKKPEDKEQLELRRYLSLNPLFPGTLVFWYRY
jgi:hypothetical protein